MELSEFLPLYREDDNRWWLLSAGDMQNLFDEAIERAEALGTQLAAANLDAARLAGAVEDAKWLLSLAQPRPGVTPEWKPRYDRWLAANNSTTSAEADANEGRATVDEMARRVDYLEIALTGDADRYGNLVRRVEALEAKSL